MNVVFVTRGALPRAGGIQAHQQTIAHALQQRGHALTIYAARVDDRPYDRLNTILGAQRFDAFATQGVRTMPFPIKRRAALLPTAASALPGIDRVVGYHRTRALTLPLVVRVLGARFREAFATQRRPDVVHAMGGEPQAHAALEAARAVGAAFVVTPFAHPGFWGDDDLNLDLYKAADAVVALLPMERDWLVDHGVPADRVHVIGVPAPEPHPDPLDVEKAGPLVLCLGVKRRYKYKLLLDALPHLHDRSTRVAFVGPLTDEWRADLSALDPRDAACVGAVAKVDEREKWGWLRVCDALCLPSVSEIMPVSILEAWRMARPVVVARGRWTHDLVSDGVDGIIVEPRPEALAEAIESVLADPQRARAMGEAGRKKVEERYTAAVVSAAHERLYEALVGAKG